MKASRSVQVQGAKPRGARLVAAGVVGALVAAGLGAVVAAPAQAAGVAPLPVGPRPNATRVEFRAAERVSASVDVGTGNLLVTTTDLTLPGVDQDVQLGLDFNSLLLGAGSALPAGAAGKGFATRLGQDTKLVANTDGTVLYLAPGGLEGLYTPITGTSGYTTPAGFKNTLTKTGTTGWTLSDHATKAVSTFTASGALSKVTDRSGNATTVTASSITATRGGGNARKATLAFTGGLLTSITQASDAAGSRTVTYGYDTVNQHLTSITDTAGGVTTFGWDAAGNLTSIDDPSTTVLNIAYDSSRRVTAVEKGPATGTRSITRFSYPSSTQTQVASPNTDQTQPVSAVPHVTYTLDGTDRVTQAVDELGRTRKTSYTPMADIASATSPAGAVTSAAYGANSGESLTKVTAPTGATASLSYTSGSVNPYAPTGGTDAQGNAAVIGYDGAGNPTSTTNSGTGAVAKVSYRAAGTAGAGTLATSTDPAGKVTSYGIDTATNQITSITPPAGSGLGATALAWDGYGRLQSVTDGRGVTTTYTYTGVDQIDTIAYSDTTPSISYTYNNSSQVQTRTDGNGTVTFTYNAHDNLIGRSATTGGGSLSWDYDLAGNLTGETTTRGTTAYTYDDANQLTSMTPPGSATTRFGYNADGLRADTWWKANADHSTFMAHTHTDYDSTGRIAGTWTSRNSSDTTKVFDTTYCYVTVAAGAPCPVSTTTSNPTKGLIQWSQDNLTAARSVYSYDAANRLTGVTNYAGHTYGYTYDANGNRKTVTRDGVQTQSLTFNTGNQITTAGYGYDMAGNTTTAPAAGTLTYNGPGQMTTQHNTTTDTTYEYAGPGQNELVTRKVTGGDTTKYVYGRNTKHGVPGIDIIIVNGAKTYLDTDPDGTPLGMELPTGQKGYFVLDGLGTVVGIVDGQGTTQATYSYDPYGTITAATGTGALVDANPYRHTTGLYDPATGYTKHGTRWNDTTTGRWTTTDPITRLNDPDQANPYTYAADNPINYNDPTGQSAASDALFVGFGALFVGFAVFSLVTLPATATVAAAVVAGSNFTFSAGIFAASVGCVFSDEC